MGKATRAWLAVLALTAILAIFKGLGWMHASLVWVVSPIWIPLAEALLVWIGRKVDGE